MFKSGSNKTIKITVAAITIVIAGLLCFRGYNSYIYNKIGECFAAKNYDMALYYTENLPKNYKDVRKIENFIRLMSDCDNNKTPDYERTIPLLEEYKGFADENINYCYNKFYIGMISSQKDAEAKDKIREYVSKNKAEAANTTKNEAINDEIDYENAVFYLESSEVFHLYRDCSTLMYSQNVLTGKIPEGRRVCKVCESR